MAYLGEIRLFAGTTPPVGWVFLNGASLPLVGNELLGQLLGSGGASIVLADARGRTLIGKPLDPGASHPIGEEQVTLAAPALPVHTHDAGCYSGSGNATVPTGNLLADKGSGNPPFLAPTGIVQQMSNLAVAATGGGQPHSNIQPFLTLQIIICVQGSTAPTPGTPSGGSFSAFGGVVRFFCFDAGLLPSTLLPADGRELSRSTFSGLFALIGTTFGPGDGSTTFNIPDLQSRAINGAGSGSGLSAYVVGDMTGEESHALTLGEMATHTHNFIANTGAPFVRAIAIPKTAMLCPTTGMTGPNQFSSLTDGSSLSSATIAGSVGGGQAHNNRQPFLEVLMSVAVDDIADIGLDTGQIIVGPWASAPTGTILCDGGSLSTTTNAALFAVIGYVFGGSGSSFNVPDLRGRIPVGVSPGLPDQNLSAYSIGQTGGAETVALTVNQLPSHSHALMMEFNNGTSFAPSGKSIARFITCNYYGGAFGTPPLVQMNADAIRNAGSSDPHENRMPQTAFNFFIAI